FNLVKELTGALVLANADSYGGTTNFTLINDPSDGTASPVSFPGGTVVAQGVLNIQNSNALASAVGTTTTTVLDGAQLQIQGGVTVANEKLVLAGTGISGTGALLSLTGANTWAGAITLTNAASGAGFSPATTPPNSVAIGESSAAAGDSLTLTGAIGQAAG